jgi:hypothetical protein
MEGDGSWLPLHFAGEGGSLDIIRFLASKYPEAAATKTLPQNKLPLHLLMEQFGRDKLPSDGVDMVRAFLR